MQQALTLGLVIMVPAQVYQTRWLSVGSRRACPPSLAASLLQLGWLTL
jgi:hypothetical protein